MKVVQEQVNDGFSPGVFSSLGGLSASHKKLAEVSDRGRKVVCMFIQPISQDKMSEMKWPLINQVTTIIQVGYLRGNKINKYMKTKKEMSDGRRQMLRRLLEVISKYEVSDSWRQVINRLIERVSK